LTIIGSSNYTNMGEQLDLEIGALIISRNEELRYRLREEQRWLVENTRVDKEEDLKAPDRGTG